MDVPTECAICIENFKGTRVKIHTTECNHTFHMKCFDKITNNSCPCCRGYVSLSPIPFAKNLKYEEKMNAIRRIAKMKVEYNRAKTLQGQRMLADSYKIATNKAILVDQQKLLISMLSVTSTDELMAQSVRNIMNNCECITSEILTDISVAKDYISLSVSFLQNLKNDLKSASESM